ncbi:MAG: diguanylate cyclase [Nitrospinae bacterium]|nr:diguanylate cyclase [Nitrospinota bacterium]
MNGKILIVDDEAGALKLLKEILTAAGHEVRPFNNGELALRSIRAEAPELILLDIRMPGMDGFEVCRRIKEDERLKDIPVIFITAATDMEDKIKAFQAGGIDYITKPFQKEEVVTRVKTHVALNRSMLQLKQIAEDLSKSEESLKMAQGIAHLGHWEWDVNTGQFAWSEETYRILGFEPERQMACYDAFMQSVHPDDKERVATYLSKVLVGSGFDIEYRIILPDGNTRAVHGIGKLISLGASRQPKIMGTIQEVPDPRKIKMLGVIQDITKRKELELRLEQQANTDFLTGCASRRRFLELAKQEFVRNKRYGGDMSVLMLDIDRFKAINDTYGHQAGDTTLIKFVQECQGILREVDFIGRMGGEEFAIILPATGGRQALEIAERLRKAVADTEVPMQESSPLRFTTSIGIASLIEGDLNAELIINRADKALYEAKNTGRNKVCAAA